MALVLYSVIRRHMKATGRYFELKDGRACPVLASLPSGEDLLGWYENPAPWEESFIAFTDRAIYGIERGDVVRIDLADLVGYEAPEKRLDVTGIRVRTRDGFRFLRVAGTHAAREGNAEALKRVDLGDRRFSDAWSLVQVLHAVAGASR
jgi:hypothetical protein